MTEFLATNTTVQELTNAGERCLIHDAKRRSELAGYYADPGIDALRGRSRYREHVRSILPARVQNEIWLNCYMTIGNSQIMQECASPVDYSEIRTVVGRFQSNETLHDEMRYRVSSLEVAQLIAQGGTQDSRVLRDDVMTQLVHK